MTLDELPPLVIGATVAAEDNNFWNHWGISWRGIARAAWFDVNNFDQEPIGGSTITQQLVKNVFFGSEKTIQRKLKEVVLSFLVEMKFSKRQILGMYLNQIPYGGTAYGIEEASQKYFSKSARDLT